MLEILLSLAVLALEGALVVSVLLRKREPSAALAWSLAIVLLPGLGLVLYLLFGINRVPRRLRRKIEHRERFSSDFAFPERTDETLEGDYPDNRWGSLGRMLERMGGAPRRAGNELEIYATGGAAFEAMCAAMESARHHIHVEYFIFRADAMGRRFLEVLERKIAEGVEVRFLVDGLGSFHSWKVVDRVRRLGGQATTFSPLLHGRLVSPNMRSHRKIVVVDGAVGFFGGLNVGVEYLGQGDRPWHDLHARLVGPGVRDLQRMFAEAWDYSTGSLLAGDAYFPALDRSGDATVQVVGGGPDVRPNPIRQAWFGAIVRARRRVLLASPYLVPDLALREALKAAARSEVAVEILTQWPPPDHRLVFECGLFWIEELLEAGVRVRGTTNAMMHAKAVVVDGTWAMIGTANLDNRSLYLNYEQTAVLDGAAEVADVERYLENLYAGARPYTLELLAGRAWPKRFVTKLARLLSPLM